MEFRIDAPIAIFEIPKTPIFDFVTRKCRRFIYNLIYIPRKYAKHFQCNFTESYEIFIIFGFAHNFASIRNFGMNLFIVNHLSVGIEVSWLFQEFKVKTPKIDEYFSNDVDLIRFLSLRFKLFKIHCTYVLSAVSTAFHFIILVFS